MMHFLAFWVFLIVVYSTAAEKLSSGEDVKNFVDRHVLNFEVMVFAKSYCPYCRATRSLLSTLEKSMGDLNVHAIDLDMMDQEDGALIQMELLQRTGQRTVPNIFIGGRHIGGNSDLQGLFSNGQLERMLENLMARHEHV